MPLSGFTAAVSSSQRTAQLCRLCLDPMEGKTAMTSSLEEKEAIRELMARFCFATDRQRDPQAVVNLFTEDGAWEGEAFGRVVGHEALRALIEKSGFDREVGLRHHITNILIEIKGDTAQARSYVALTQVGPEGPKPFFDGFYEDTFAKVG